MLGTAVSDPRCASAFRRKDDAEQNTLVGSYLLRSADVSTPIGRDHVVNLVIGNRYPFGEPVSIRHPL
jgi:hypothetical protein